MLGFTGQEGWEERHSNGKEAWDNAQRQGGLWCFPGDEEWFSMARTHKKAGFQSDHAEP